MPTHVAFQTFLASTVPQQLFIPNPLSAHSSFLRQSSSPIVCCVSAIPTGFAQNFGPFSLATRLEDRTIVSSVGPTGTIEYQSSRWDGLPSNRPSLLGTAARHERDVLVAMAQYPSQRDCASRTAEAGMLDASSAMPVEDNWTRKRLAMHEATAYSAVKITSGR
ncbi:unnamed protein product [Protopolystoma xenopodis]|uniref:Uncharacterized protein n=1 Tax=Protopolystoma xenopodis TaxID=117903 RepID=A0A3S5A8R3_9PLAT|nr:unnamed protein product [Protopolystoma xenopodis]